MDMSLAGQLSPQEFHRGVFINDFPRFFKLLSECSLMIQKSRLTEWARKWQQQQQFNGSKYTVLHLGHKPSHTSSMETGGASTSLSKTDIVRILWVHVHSELKFSKHTEIRTKKANKLLGLIRRSFSYIDKDEN